MAHLAIWLLGTFHITRGSTPITEFASNKVRGLLAYLAVESDRPHTRDALASLLWPDYPNASALTNLRNTLANLRRVIGDQEANPPYLLITNETVQFNRDSDYGLDVTELVQLAADHHRPPSSCQLTEMEWHTDAANCYRGPFLAGFSIPDSIAFEEWTSLWRERLGQIALEELRWLAGFYEARGEYTLALEYARRQVALDPWLEEGHRQIMRILAITGQRGAALTQYDTCKRVLANDLGVDPADETRRLYAAICAGQIETLRPGRVLPAPGEPPYRGLCFFDEPDAAWFFGRELLTARLAELVEEIAKGKEGEFPLLAIVGASGSGKSSLVRAGVVPLLRKTGWEVQVITPSNNLPAALEPGRTRKRRESHTIRRHLLVIDQFEELFSLVREENERLVFLNRIFEPNLPILLVLRADFYGHCAPYPRLRSALSAHQEYIGAMDAGGLRRAIEEPARRGGWELEPGLSDLLLQDIGAADEHPPEPGALPLLEHALLETWFHRRGRVLTLAGYAETGGVRQAIARTAERVYDSLSPGDQVMARRVFLHLTELGEGTQGTRRRASFSELRELAAVGQVVDDLLSTLAKARLVTLGEETAEVAHEALIREWPALQGWLAEDRDGLRLHRHITESAATWERLGRDPGEFYRGAHLAQALEWARQSEHWQDLTLLEDEFLQVSREHEELEALEHEAQRQRELEFAQQFAEAQRQRAEEREQAARELYQESQLAYARELAAHSRAKLTSQPDLSQVLALEAVEVLEKAGMPILWDVQQALHDVALNMRLLWNHDTSTLPWSVVYAPDGKRVYYEDNQDVFALDATTGSELFVIQSAMQRGTTVQISADGKYLATANANRACLWDPQTGQKLLTIPLPGCKPDFGSVKALSPDGRLLLVNYDLDTAQLIDLSPWLTEGSPSGVTRSLPYQLIERCSHIAAGSAFSPDGTCFTTPWLEDNIVILWDSKTARPLRTFSGHTATPMGNSFSPDGSRLATCGYDGTLRIWEVSSGRELIRLSGHNGLVNKVAFSPDGLRLSSTSTEGQVSLWNATNGHRLFDLPTGSGAFGAAFSPDGTRLFVSTHGNQVQLWDVTGCGQGEMKILPFNPGCVSIICSEEGDCILETYANGSIVVRDTSSLAEIASIQAFPNGNSTIATGINRGHTCLATMQQGVYKLWDLARNRQLYEIPPQEGYKPQTDLVPAFHPDGKFLVTGYDPQSISVRDINSSQVLWKLPILQKMIFCDQFSPDGNLLAIGGSRDVLEMGGEWVISLGGGLVSVFQMPMPGEAASEPVVFHGDTRNIRRMSFSPDSKYLAVCGSDEHAEIWDPLTGTLIMHLLSHQSEVTDVHYSPNGCFLVTASQDGTVKIWDASSGTELLSYHLPGNAPCTLACFTPDGQQVIAASEAGYYHQLTFQNFTDLLAILRSRTTRDWSPEERRMYLRKETSTRQFQQPNS